MADLLERVLHEVRERKERARAAVEQNERLDAALVALDRDLVERAPAPQRSTNQRRTAGRPPAPRGANRAAVIGVVSERPGVSVGDVAGATGIAGAVVTRTLARLVADGTLERVELPAGTLGYRVAEAAGDERSAGEGQQ
jgi:type II secretory pathway component PulJ